MKRKHDEAFENTDQMEIIQQLLHIIEENKKNENAKKSSVYSLSKIYKTIFNNEKADSMVDNIKKTLGDIILPKIEKEQISLSESLSSPVYKYTLYVPRPLSISYSMLERIKQMDKVMKIIIDPEVQNNSISIHIITCDDKMIEKNFDSKELLEYNKKIKKNNLSQTDKQSSVIYNILETHLNVNLNEKIETKNREVDGIDIALISIPLSGKISFSQLKCVMSYNVIKDISLTLSDKYKHDVRLILDIINFNNMNL